MFTRRGLGLMSVVVVASLLQVAWRGVAWSQTCYDCGVSGSACHPYSSDGATGCDDSSGHCVLFGNGCGLGGGDGSDFPPKLPNPHRGRLTIEEGIAGYTRVMYGVLFAIGAPTGRALF